MLDFLFKKKEGPRKESRPWSELHRDVCDELSCAYCGQKHADRPRIGGKYGKIIGDAWVTEIDCGCTWDGWQDMAEDKRVAPGA